MVCANKTVTVISALAALSGQLLFSACGDERDTKEEGNQAKSDITTIAYTNSPIEPGAFEAFQVVLDLETLKYTVPARDGYGTFRFDETKICFFASYSNKERCIDFLFAHQDWAVGQSWDMNSYDGKPIKTTVDVIK